MIITVGPRLVIDDLAVFYDSRNAKSFNSSYSNKFNDLMTRNIANSTSGVSQDSYGGLILPGDDTKWFDTNQLPSAFFNTRCSPFSITTIANIHGYGSTVSPYYFGGLFSGSDYYTAVGGQGFGLYLTRGKYVLQMTYDAPGFNAYNRNTYVFSDTSPVINFNTIEMITVTYEYVNSIGTARFYRNGSLVFTHAHANQQWDLGGTRDFWIGMGRQGGWQHCYEMDFYLGMLHTKKLSNNEVLQNYEALRHRYGI